jgi:hypothetical protein
MGTCDATPWTEDASCQACLEESCCFALNACEPGSECLALDACLDGCAGDILCAEDCVAMHEGGVNAIDAVAACNEDTCDACADVPPTTYDACATVLSQYPNAPDPTCVQDNCCDELVACENDAACDVQGALFGDSAPSPLLTCIVDHCSP